MTTQPQNLIPLKELVAMDNLARDNPDLLEQYLDRYTSKELQQLALLMLESWEYYETTWKVI